VLDTYATYKARYGAPRIAEELNAIGIPCSLNHVANVMVNNGLKARNGKAFKYSCSGEAMNNVADNLLWRNFKAGKANTKWTSDITYIWVKDRWLYLATVMDLFSRKIVGWAVDTTMTEELITTALNMAFELRDVKSGLIIHSDRGVQYRAHKYQDLIRAHGGKVSMSRKGNCWDNAPMESFFSRFKVELIYAEQYDSIEEAKSGIFEYIEIFYNRLRRHSAIGYVSPAEFERLCA
jgi:transposase InsO family protein